MLATHLAVFVVGKPFHFSDFTADQCCDFVKGMNGNYTATSNSLSAAGFWNLPKLSGKILISGPP